MSNDLRRIPLQTSLAGNATAASMRLGVNFVDEQTMLEKPTSLDPKTHSGSKVATIRMELDLEQADSSTYAVFNYKRLLHIEKKKSKIIKQKQCANTNGPASDPFEDNDDDVARIAKQMEEKYGTGYIKSRGRSKKDEQDIGQGYDENDSFIDNTDAYDEIIPEEVETLEGGFYINSGALQFQSLHTETAKTKTDEIIKIPNRLKKRVISSSESSSSSSDEDEEDLDEDNDEEDEEETGEDAENELDYKASSGASTSSKADKCAKSTTTTTATDTTGELANGNLKKHKHNVNKVKIASKKDVAKTMHLSSSSSNSPKPSIDDGIGSEDSEKERRQKVVSVKDVVLQAKRDKFFKMRIDGEIKGSAGKSSENDTSESSTSDDNCDTNDEAQAPDKKLEPKKIKPEMSAADTKSPQDIDASILAEVDTFLKNLKEKNIKSKKFMFDDELTMTFLKLDDQLVLQKTHRSTIYAQMEVQLSLQKSFFLRKAKQLRTRVEKQKNKRLLAKLRRAIASAMPMVNANYEMELRKYADLQSSTLLSDDPPMLPRKVFPWSENLRSLLLDVYHTYWSSYSILGTVRKHTREEYMQDYLKSQVVPLWPIGWMRYEELQREIERLKALPKKIKERKKHNASPVATDLTINKTNASSTKMSSLISEAAAQDAKSVSNNNSHSTFSNEATLANGMAINLHKRKAPADSLKMNKNKAMKSNTVPEKHGAKSEEAKTNQPVNMHVGKSNFGSKKVQPDSSIATIIIDSNRRSDHSIHNIMSTQSILTTSASMSSVYTSGTVSQPQPTLSQGQSSSTSCTFSNGLQTHVIDVEKYKSPSEILLLTSQKLQASAAATCSPERAQSLSSDSEVVFVQEFPPNSHGEKDASSKNKSKKSPHLPCSYINNDVTVTMTSMNPSSNSLNPLPKSSSSSGMNICSTGLQTSNNFTNNNYMKSKKLSSNTNNYNSLDMNVDSSKNLQAARERQRQEKSGFLSKESSSQQ